MAAVPVQDFQEQALPRFLRLDPLLLLATLGLVAASVYFVRGATLDDVAGDPNYFMYRQLVYAGVGLVLMLLRGALRLLAPARVEVGRVRVHDRLDRARLRDGRLRPRVASARSSSASSTSRPRSWARCCW